MKARGSRRRLRVGSPLRLIGYLFADLAGLVLDAVYAARSRARRSR
jgi:hypothetical protein